MSRIFGTIGCLGDDVFEGLEYLEYFKPGFGLMGAVVKSYRAYNIKRLYKYKMVLQSANAAY